jgi:hypothetical protein
MVRKPRKPPEPVTRYENFLYLLAELERVVASGKIECSAASALEAWHRLGRLTAAVRQLATRK